MMMRKVYTTPAYFTMLLLKFFNLLLIFLSRPYVARNRCRFGRLAGGGFLVCGLFWVVSWELVVHSTEWTTGAALFLVFGLVWAISWELVVHSMEWTTGAALFLVFGLSPYNCVKRKSQVISGT
uniref:hypothetical protein n=1 Tax=Abiotrophia defectiva TaxID=46125 RepID=UPI0028EE0693